MAYKSSATRKLTVATKSACHKTADPLLIRRGGSEGIGPRGIEPTGLREWERRNISNLIAVISRTSAFAAVKKWKSMQICSSRRRPLVLEETKGSSALRSDLALQSQLERVTGRPALASLTSAQVQRVNASVTTRTGAPQRRAVDGSTGANCPGRSWSVMIGRSFKPRVSAAKPTKQHRRGGSGHPCELTQAPSERRVDAGASARRSLAVAGLEGQGQRELFYAVAGDVRLTGCTVTVAEQARQSFLTGNPRSARVSVVPLQMRSDFNLTLR